MMMATPSTRKERTKFRPATSSVGRQIFCVIDNRIFSKIEIASVRVRRHESRPLISSCPLAKVPCPRSRLTSTGQLVLKDRGEKNLFEDIYDSQISPLHLHLRKALHALSQPRFQDNRGQSVASNYTPPKDEIVKLKEQSRMKATSLHESLGRF